MATEEPVLRQRQMGTQEKIRSELGADDDHRQHLVLLDHPQGETARSDDVLLHHVSGPDPF